MPPCRMDILVRAPRSTGVPARALLHTPVARASPPVRRPQAPRGTGVPARALLHTPVARAFLPVRCFTLLWHGRPRPCAASHSCGTGIPARVICSTNITSLRRGGDAPATGILLGQDCPCALLKPRLVQGRGRPCNAWTSLSMRLAQATPCAGAGTPLQRLDRIV